LGVALVLLTPCTDWMNTFTLLGRGDVHRTLAATPLLLVAQIVLLPAYLWLFLDADAGGVVGTRPFWFAFAGLVATPLSLAWFTEWRGHRSQRIARWIKLSTPLPVCFLAATVFVIAASQIQQVLDQARQLTQVTAVFCLYVAAAAVVGWFTVRLFSLSPKVGRGVVFSVGTRNSFVVLPLALALPAEWNLAVAVIVIQAFVEMLGMLACIRLVPGWLLPEDASGDMPASTSAQAGQHIRHHPERPGVNWARWRLPAARLPVAEPGAVAFQPRHQLSNAVSHTADGSGTGLDPLIFVAPAQTIPSPGGRTRAGKSRAKPPLISRCRIGPALTHLAKDA
jgi:hypothetical protein